MLCYAGFAAARRCLRFLVNVSFAGLGLGLGLGPVGLDYKTS